MLVMIRIYFIFSSFNNAYLNCTGYTAPNIMMIVHAELGRLCEAVIAYFILSRNLPRGTDTRNLNQDNYPLA